MAQFRYFAFISYSHGDRAWAAWLHRALETYRVPPRLVGRATGAGTIPASLVPVFRDRDELPSATDLGRTVNEALAQSANLIVICSPRSAASKWVDEEIRAFKRLGRSERVFCLIIDGEPHAAPGAADAEPTQAAQECFAPALRFQVGVDGTLTTQRTEPIAADARPGKDGRRNALLKLIAGLLGVGFDELRQRELQRRHRRMVAVTALALALTSVTTALAISAVIARRGADVARQAAERRQKQAEHLVGFMLGDLNDKLAEVQRLDIMEAVDDQAMQYFQSLPTTDVTDEALAQRAKALEKIGSVRMDQGHLPAAMQAYQASLKVTQALAVSAPGDITRQVAHARTWSFIGRTDWYQGRLDDALRGFESAQAILRRARASAPGDLQVRFELATVDNNIGHVLESRGRFDEAAVQYGRMLGLTQSLVAQQPQNTQWLVQSGLAHNNLGKMALMRGDLATAIAEYSADDRIEAALSARDPKDNNQRENVLLVRGILGRTLALVGDADAGIAHLREAAAIATQLLAVDPDNASVREDVALCATQLGRLLRLEGDLPAATVEATRALDTLSRLSRQDPANTGWRREYAEARLELAELAHAEGHAASARAQLGSALALLEPLFVAEPDDRATLLAVVQARLLSATLDEATDRSKAEQGRQGALRAMQRQNDRDPRLAALRIAALLGLHRGADVGPSIQRLWHSGYRDGALLAVLRQADIAYPANPRFQAALGAGDRIAGLTASTTAPAGEAP